jgi:iron complex transport system ATP-binding protein
MSTPALELRDVSFAYREGAGRFRLEDLSVALTPGEILGVIGANASGKTTLVRLVSGILRPDRGEVRLHGTALGRLGAAAIARSIAVVPQDVPRGFPYRAGELVLMGRYPHRPSRFFEDREDRRIAAQAMERVGVAHLAGELVDRLSGGERQRLLLARALAQEPRVLALDEPTAHLDLRHQAECVSLLRQLNREQGLTVLLVSHDLDVAAQIAGRLLLLDGGRVARLGPPEEVLEAGLLEAVYGCPVVVTRHPTTGRPAVAVDWAGHEERHRGAGGERGEERRGVRGESHA